MAMNGGAAAAHHGHSGDHEALLVMPGFRSAAPTRGASSPGRWGGEVGTSRHDGEHLAAAGGCSCSGLLRRSASEHEVAVAREAGDSASELRHRPLEWGASSTPPLACDRDNEAAATTQLDGELLIERRADGQIERRLDHRGMEVIFEDPKEATEVMPEDLKEAAEVEAKDLDAMCTATTAMGTGLTLGSANSRSSIHPLMSQPDLLDNIRLISAKDFVRLPCPLARSQDLPPSNFAMPTSNDIVFSVSHAWRNQTHPDPKGSKHRVICELLSQENLEEGRVLVFLDWLGISQRPFRPGQAPRSMEESEQFAVALHQMHNMFFYADRIIHLASQDERIEGEGMEYTVSSTDLQGAQFAEIGDWVQIVGGERDDAGRTRSSLQGFRSLRSSTGAPTWQLFDRVLMVDDEEVTSASELQALLCQTNAPARTVLLARYPYGRVNDIPADARGWVYLERFITMVKCAMLDEEAASNVVVTNCPLIREQILSGAARLREAALKDENGRRSRHAEVLQGFLDELETKRFSAASTDKLELDSRVTTVTTSTFGSGRLPDDREVVGDIMTEFVEHLCKYWKVEARRQQVREKRLGTVLKAAEAYFLKWDHFSDKYMEELAAVSARDPLPLLAILILPPLLTLAWLLLPFADPDESWRSQALWVWYGQSLSSALTHHMFPQFLAVMAGAHRDWEVEVKCYIWTLLSSVSSAALRALLVRLWDVFPLPMTSALAAGWCGLWLPLLWLCIPRHQRVDRSFRKRAFCAYLAIATVVAIFGVLFPLLNVGIFRLPPGWQALAVLAYVISVLGFEKMGSVVATYVGADVMPCFSFTGAFLCQFNLCMALAGGFHPLVYAGLIALELAETIYYHWSLARKVSSHPPKGQEAGADGRPIQYYIASTVVLREFAQLVAQAHFLVSIIAARSIRPQFSDLICALTVEDFGVVVLTVGLSMAVESAVAAGSVVFLWRYGFSPWHMLLGLLSTRRSVMVAIPVVAAAYNMGLQFAHGGNDLNFDFPWLRGPRAHWQCGLQWTVTQ